MDTRGEVKIYDKDKTQPGYILYCAYAGDEIVIIDREGRAVHSWKVRPHVKLPELLPDGHVMFGWMRRGMVELDWNGHLSWRYNCQQHHDFYRHPDGRVVALCHEYRFNNRIWDGAMFKNCWFVEVDRAGNELWEWHSDEHIDELIELTGAKFPSKRDDWTHCNTVEALPATPLGEKDSRFREGNVLFSYRTIDTIGIIDRQTDRIVWAWGPGEIERQHMPTLLPNGRMLVFDNGSIRKQSRVIEIDPSTNEITWEYRLPDHAFSSALSGQEQLPNGNILICAGPPGVLLEVTREGEIVWEYHNRMPGGNPKGSHSVYRAMFCPAGQIEPRLQI
jgi:hypothetical protein